MSEQKSFYLSAEGEQVPCFQMPCHVYAEMLSEKEKLTAELQKYQPQPPTEATTAKTESQFQALCAFLQECVDGVTLDCNDDTFVLRVPCATMLMTNSLRFHLLMTSIGSDVNEETRAQRLKKLHMIGTAWFEEQSKK